ncbi:MAG TPA: DUF5011 domain-containing protein, partial [Campylobacterales bacterium]|nr:DUF5011 domain-containing protein [Campylobacterales bacterium]
EYGYEAIDTVDGDLTNAVERTHNIDFTRAGTYTITYFVEDSDGYTDTKTRTVTIVDGDYDAYSGGGNVVGSAPTITFTDGKNSDFLSLGEQYVAPQYVANDFEDGDLTYWVQTQGLDFDVYTAGTHTVTYSVSDQDGNVAYAYRTVYVGDYGTAIGGSTTSGTLEAFKTWYSTTCGQSFNETLYDATTREYRGDITCSYRNLSSIDLSTLSVFLTIKSLDLSHNNLDYINFDQLGLDVNNEKILEDLDLSYNNFSYIDFTPLHNLRNINNLWIQGNNLDYDTVEKREALYEIFNNRSLTIYF